LHSHLLPPSPPSAILNADGNATTQSALLNVILSVPAPNVRCNAKRLSVPNVLFIANSLSVLLDALKICVKKMIALSVRLSVLLLNAELLVSLLKRIVHLYAKRLNAIGLALNLLPVLVLNVSYNARNLLVISKMSNPNKLAAHVLVLI